MTERRPQALCIGDLTASLPIIQGGMGVGVSLAGLAAAVANAGGIGVIATAGIGMIEPDLFQHFEAANLRALRKEIRRAKALSPQGILGVNIMVALSNFGELVTTAIAEGIDVIFSGAGLPLDLPQYLPGGGRTKLVPIVSSGRAARIIARRWTDRYAHPPDAIVVEGPRAGGHLGFKAEQIDDPAYALEALLADVLAEIRPFEAKARRPIPVIAGGGIYTGATSMDLQLGAAGVQMATRFVTTTSAMPRRFQGGLPPRDAGGPPDHREPGGHARPRHPEPVPRRREPGRNALHLSLPLHHHVRLRQQPLLHRPRPHQCPARQDGPGFAFAGDNAHRATEIVSVSELIRTLFAEYHAASA